MIHITEAQHINDPILRAIKKYEKHPSIIKIADNISINNKFSFSTVPPKDIEAVVNSLDVSKSTTYCNIPTKVFNQNFDICSGVLTNIYNNCTVVPNFPLSMKLADANPIYKMDDYTDKIIIGQLASCLLHQKYLND